jgi:hypothetical protein
MLNCTICITRYNEPDYIFINSLVAISEQKDIYAKVFVLDQSVSSDSQGKIEHLCQKLSNGPILFDYLCMTFNSLSDARNFVLRNSSHEKVLFLDCDAAPINNWAFLLTKELSNPRTAVA